MSITTLSFNMSIVTAKMNPDQPPPPSGRAASGAAWRDGLPVMKGQGVMLRELCQADAASLLALVVTADVSPLISPPPTTIEGFERFIIWTHLRRAAGQYACFAVVPDGCETTVGLFQVRQIEPGFVTAEWGFALGSPYWGSGLFVEGARMVMEFTFGVIGAYRLEARAAVKNGRGNGALAKIGATREAVLRRSFLKGGEYLDQNLWAIIQEDWLQAQAIWGPKLH